MKGLVIQQTTSEYHTELDISQFAITKLKEYDYGQGSYSKILGYDICELWNQTIQHMCRPNNVNHIPFRMVFK